MTVAGIAPAARAAFQERLRRDRAAIASLDQELRAGARWRAAATGIAEIESLAHRLAGAAGIFDRPALGEAALRVELLAERWRRHPPPGLTPRRVALLRRRIGALLRALARAQG